MGYALVTFANFCLGPVLCTMMQTGVEQSIGWSMACRFRSWLWTKHQRLQYIQRDQAWVRQEFLAALRPPRRGICSPSRGHRPGKLGQWNRGVGPTGQLFGDWLARWAEDERSCPPFLRATPWAGRPAGPSAHMNDAKKSCRTAKPLASRCCAIECIRSATGGVPNVDAAGRG